jgi:hypothetical protein
MARNWAAWLGLCGALVPWAGAGAAAPADLVVTVSVGYGADKPFVLGNHWAPAFVRVMNKGPAIQGELRLGPVDEDVSTVVPVDLPEKCDKVFRLPLFVPERIVGFNLHEASIHVGRREAAREVFTPIVLGVQNRLVLAPLDDPPLWVAGPLGAFLERAGLEAKAVVLPGRPERLDAELETLHSLHAIVWDGAAMRAVSDEIAEALALWVDTGGVLICAGGPDASMLGSSALAKHLPARYGGLRKLRLSPDDSHEVMARDLTRLRGQTVWGPADNPWAVAESRGRGRIVVLAPSLRSPQAEKCLELQRLLAYWLRPTRPFLSDLPGVEWSETLDAIHNEREHRIVSREQVQWWILFYIVLVGPLNFWLFRRLNLREWAWPAGAILAAGACAFLYYRGPLSQGRRITVTGIRLVEPAGAGDLCRTRTFASIRSVQRKDLRIDLPKGAVGLEGSPLSRGRSGGAGRQGRTVLDSRPRLEDFRLRAAAARAVSWRAWERVSDLPGLTLTRLDGNPEQPMQSSWLQLQWTGSDEARPSAIVTLSDFSHRGSRQGVFRPSDLLWMLARPLRSGYSDPYYLRLEGLLKPRTSQEGSRYRYGGYGSGANSPVTFRSLGSVGDDHVPVGILGLDARGEIPPLETSAGGLEIPGRVWSVFLLPRPEPQAGDARVASPAIDRWMAVGQEDGAKTRLRDLTPQSRFEAKRVAGRWILDIDLYPFGNRADQVVVQSDSRQRGTPSDATAERGGIGRRLANGWLQPIRIDPERAFTLALDFRASWRMASRGSRELAAVPEAVLIAAGNRRIHLGQGHDFEVSGALPLICADDNASNWRGRWRGNSQPSLKADSREALALPHYRLRLNWPAEAAPEGEQGRIVVSDLSASMAPASDETTACLVPLPPGKCLVMQGEKDDSH